MTKLASKDYQRTLHHLKAGFYSQKQSIQESDKLKNDPSMSKSFSEDFMTSKPQPRGNLGKKVCTPDQLDLKKAVSYTNKDLISLNRINEEKLKGPQRQKRGRRKT